MRTEGSLLQLNLSNLTVHIVHVGLESQKKESGKCGRGQEVGVKTQGGQWDQNRQRL